MAIPRARPQSNGGCCCAPSPTGASGIQATATVARGRAPVPGGSGSANASKGRFTSAPVVGRQALAHGSRHPDGLLHVEGDPLAAAPGRAWLRSGRTRTGAAPPRTSPPRPATLLGSGRRTRSIRETSLSSSVTITAAPSSLSAILRRTRVRHHRRSRTRSMGVGGDRRRPTVRGRWQAEARSLR
jgi:hypothetical protein